MAKRRITRRRRRAFSSLGMPTQVDIETKGRAAIASAEDQAQKASGLIEHGNCKLALQHVVTARSASATAGAFYAMGARLPGLNDAAKKVQAVVQRFNIRCVK
jgi:hypothetical protein